MVFAKVKPFVVPEASLKSGDKEGKDETQLGDLEDLSDNELIILQEAIKAVEAVLSFAKGEKGTDFDLKWVKLIGLFAFFKNLIFQRNSTFSVFQNSQIFRLFTEIQIFRSQKFSFLG